MLEKRDIIGYGGRYQITRDGDVYETIKGQSTRISAWIDGVDYQRVQLERNGHKRFYTIKELIMNTYENRGIKSNGASYLYLFPQKLSTDDTLEIVRLINESESDIDIATKFDIDDTTVRSIRLGYSKSYITGIEKFSRRNKHAAG